MQSVPSNSVTYSSGLSSVDVDQYLSMHGVTVARQATDQIYNWGNGPYVISNAGYGFCNGYLPFYGSSSSPSTIEMPFNVFTNCYNSVVARIPVNLNPTAYPSSYSFPAPKPFVNPLDLNIKILGDDGSGGYNPGVANPSVVYGTAILPKEIISAATQSTWPEPSELICGPITYTQQTVASDNVAYGESLVTAGSVAIRAGGYIATNNTISANSNRVNLAVYLNGTLGPWQQGTPLPTASSSQPTTTFVPVSIAYDSVTGFIILAGQGTASTTSSTSVSTSTSVYTALIGQTGTMGAWVKQTDMPVALANCYTTVVNISGTSYILVFSTDKQTIYYSPVTDGGFSWSSTTAPGPFPSALQSFSLSPLGQPYGSSTAPYVVNNGTANPIVLISDSSGNFYRLSITAGPTFSTITALPTVASGRSPYIIGFTGTNFVYATYQTLGPNNISTVALDSTASNLSVNAFYQGGYVAGSAPTSTWIFNNNDGTYSMYGYTYQGSGQHIQTYIKLYSVNWINVPITLNMPLSASTSTGNFYHLSITSSTGNNSTGVNLPIVSFPFNARTASSLGSPTSVTLSVTLSSSTYYTIVNVGSTAGYPQTNGFFEIVHNSVPILVSYSYIFSPTAFAGCTINSYFGSVTFSVNDPVNPVAWSSVSGYVPFQLWSGTSFVANSSSKTGNVVALMEPSSTDTRTSYLYYGPNTNVLASAGEWSSNVRAMYGLGYDSSSGQLITVTDISGIENAAYEETAVLGQ
jgi:hypothetical protein